MTAAERKRRWYWERGGRQITAAFRARRREEIRAELGRKRHEHRCRLCDKAGHNAVTCRNCEECGRPGEWKTNRGRLCQACLEAAA